ncbi:MAG TPA: hypothetical protein VKR30_07785 [Candidatus Limnocylindrales bacterium]|nr:hypothetical protein [Candidatus Limnocylindrales bacterium]
MSSHRLPARPRLAAILAAAACLSLLLAGTAQAHIVKTFGGYTVALGWKVEPTYVGIPNAVQVIVTDSKGKAVTDIPDGDLTVVVSLSGQSSAALPLNNAFDSDTGLGIPGDYEASLDPTVPGDYTFHLNGKIHGVAVDETATASDSTFNSVVDGSSVDFPTKLPSISDVATAVSRLEARASAAPAASSGPDVAAMAQAAQTAASDAASAAASAQAQASTALQVGILVGAVGIVVGVAALFVATRRRTGAA